MTFAHRILAAAALLILATGSPALAQNRLGAEPSPYLQLHATDPVNWWPWGEAALAEAKRADKPIFLSIGYLACHWCHVMQKENYENPETATLMNELFVNIVVDREERPDIDALYMQAAELMKLPTGWPLNMFLTPDGRPFYGGVYFPPGNGPDNPGFPEVLRVVANTYRDEPDDLQAYGRKVMAVLEAQRPASTQPPTRAQMQAAWRTMVAEIDVFGGGFGASVKYPRLPAMNSLWRAWLRGGEAEYRDAVSYGLETMANSALYDHLGGGFARYATDPGWRIPHFEKMLDINAQMVSSMTEVWRDTRSPLLAARTEETVGFMLREMRMKGGAFGSSLDADSEGTEGAFYVWTEAEIDRVLGADAALFKRAYDISSGGNWENTNILHRLESDIVELARSFNLASGEIERRLGESRKRLFDVRARRVRPAFDAKVVADWNGLAIAAIAEAGAAFQRPDWIAAAREAYGFVRENLRQSDGRLNHVWRGGKAGASPTAEDYAELGLAALVLFEITGETAYLDDSRAYAETVQGHWDADGGGFLQVAADADLVLPSLKLGFDGQAPSGNASMAELLARLYFMTGEDSFRRAADATLAVFSADAQRWPIDHGAMLSAADTLKSAVQIVIIGRRGDKQADDFLGEAWRTATPGRVLQVIAPGTTLPDGHPAQHKEQLDGLATAYVCVGTFCSLPQTEPAEFAEAVRFVRRVDKTAAARK